MSMKIAAAFVGALLACSVAQTAALAQPVAHLYVDGSDAVARYPLQGGLPASHPDLMIRGYGTLAAVAPDGTVYTHKGLFSRVIYAFARNATVPERQFSFPPACGPYYTVLTGSAVDPAGNFWVTVTYYNPGGSVGKHSGAVPPVCGAMAFSPKARGPVRPIGAFAPAGNYGLQIDKRGHLYVDFDGDALGVHEVGDILTHPRVLKRYRGAYFNEYGTAISVDDADDLFVRTTLSNGGTGIAVWKADADPQGPPTTVIAPEAGTVYDLAVEGENLFVSGARPDAVDVYHAHRNGPQSPFFTLPIAGYHMLGPIAIGP